MCDADSLQAGLVCKLRNTLCPKSATVWCTNVPHASHGSSITHVHKAAPSILIDSPKGFGMGFIVHN